MTNSRTFSSDHAIARTHDPTTLNRLHGRAKGKLLRVYQQGPIHDLLPRLLAPAEWGKSPQSACSAAIARW